MKTLLLVHASPRGEASDSRRLAERFAEDFARTHGAQIVRRDLSAAPVPHLDGATIGAMFTPADALTPAQSDLLTLSNAIVSELSAADYLVISSPMYNYAIPSVLKAWVDHFVRAGLTFRYTERGPEGLLQDRPTWLILTRGGLYSGPETAPLNHQDTYLTSILSFIGISSVTTVVAEGLAYGPDAASTALAGAADRLSGLV